MLNSAIKKLGTRKEVIFRDADKDNNGKIDMDEFKKALKRCIPGSMLSYTDICMIFKSFDINQNGVIEEQEFNQRLTDCENSVFYEKLIEKICEERNYADVNRPVVAKAKESDDFPSPPLP